MKGNNSMCYAFSLAGAIITSIIWRKKRTQKLWWLNLMFLGAALFGLIDHAWNKELFYVSENLSSDLLLGIIIAASVFAFWVFIKDNIKEENIEKLKIEK